MEQVTLLNKVQSAIADYTQKGGSASEIAKMASISPAAISQIKAGTYKAKGSTALLKIAKALNVSLSESLHFSVKGDNFNKLLAICADAHQNKGNYFLDGTSGLGKSYAFKWYKKQSPKTIYIEIKKSHKIKDLVNMMLRQVNVSPDSFKGSIGARMAKLAEKAIEGGYTFIIDQIEFATKTLYEYIWEVYDHVQGQCGIILCGCGGLDKIINLGIHKERSGYQQIARRFQLGMRRLAPIDTKYIKKVCNSLEINDKEAINFLCYHCRELDMLNKMISKVLAYCETEQKEPTGTIFQGIFKNYVTAMS